MYQNELDVAVDAALKAGAVIRSHMGRLRAADQELKGMNDLVTVADEAAQEVILERLTSAFPDHHVLAEEGDSSETMRTETDGYLWIVDPIDGTANFVHGVYPHAVSIGLQHEGRLAVGVVYELGRDELFTATRGGGTFLNGRRQRVTETNTLGESLVATGFPFRSHTFRYADAYLNVLRTFMSQCHGVRRLGSAAVDMAYVCCGRFDGFFEMGLSPWDVAAGALLVEEAGGRVTDFSAEERAPLFNGQMIATNSRLHGAFQEAIGPLREALRDG